MADRIQQRRDTAANWAKYNPILLEGEVGYVLDNPNQYKIGDGEHAWNDLPLRGYTGTISQELGDAEDTVVSQKVVTEELQNVNAFTLIGEGETLISRKIGSSLPIGVPMRIYVKNTNVDYTGISYNSYSYDRFAIAAKNENDESIEILFKVGMDTKTPLNPYYDVMLPEGTKYVIVTMRAAVGFEQSIWLSGVSLVDNIKDGGKEQPLSAEQGMVLGSLASKVRLVGENDVIARSNYIKGIISGHIYRIHINPNIDLSGITVTGAYDLFAIVAYSDETYEDSNVLFKRYVTDTLEPYYDIMVPESHSYALLFSMRATAGAEQIITIEDITEQIDNIRSEEELKLNSGEAIELYYNDSNVFSDKKQISVLDAEGGYAIGEDVANLGTVDNANCKNIIIDLPAADKIAWLEIHNHYNTTINCGSFLTDENNIITNLLLNKNHIADNMAIIVPPGSKRLILSIINNIHPTIILHPFSEVDRLVNDNYGAEEKITSFFSMSSLQSQGYNFNNDIIGQSLFTGLTTNNSDAFVYLVPLWGYKNLRAIHFRTGSAYGSAFVDENMKIVGSLIKRNVNDTALTDWVNIPENAKFLCYVDYKIVTQERYIELLNDSAAKGAIDNPEAYVNGDIVDDAVVDSRTSLLLPVIPMDKGFHITLNEGYEFKSAHLYYNGSLVCTDYHPNPRGGDGNVMSPFEYFDYRMFSINQILPQLSIRLVVIKSDGSEISPSELFIKEKTIINYTDFKRLEGENILEGKQDIARRRINQFLNLVWKAEEDIYPSNPNDYKNTHFKKGRTYISSIYSETSEYSKYLGWCVSFRTYLTALMNKRSVMYTERISQTNNKSEYGINYSGLGNYYCNPYYGTVCTGLTQYALNLPNLYISGAYHNGSVPNTTKIDGANSSNVQPLDYLWNNGHCSIISDILLDEEGNRKFIVWAEQTFPVAKNTVYTLEEFDERCRVKGIEVWRYSKWDTVVEPEPTPYIQSNKWEWQTPLVVDKDFHLFCGDYAAFAKGDPIFFNANRSAGYAKMVVYNEEDDAMSTALVAVELSSLENDGLYPEDGEDWVKINFTINSLPAGKYKARLTSDTLASGFVHFEIVEVDFSATTDGHSTDMSYSCSENGTPVLVRRESPTGMYNIIAIIDDGKKENEIHNTWNDYSTYMYLKLYVKADYGMVIKRIDMSQQTE